MKQQFTQRHAFEQNLKGIPLMTIFKANKTHTLKKMEGNGDRLPKWPDDGTKILFILFYFLTVEYRWI